MRTLHADLITAQQDVTGAPFIRLAFRSRDRTTERTFTTADATNRIASVRMIEQPFSEDSLPLGVTDMNLPISAIITLRDADNTLNVLDFKGYRCDIGWGYNTASGDRYSEGPPVFVIEQRTRSAEGEIFTELYCMSLMDLLKLTWQKQTSTAQISYGGNVSVRHLLMELLGGSVANAVVLFEATGSTYTSYTAAAVNPTSGGDLGTPDDVQVMPATAASGDALYVGSTAQFDRVSVDLTTAGAGTYSITWEYWNGTIWAGFSPNPVDNTDDWKTSGLNIVQLDRETNWATQNLNGTDSAFPNSSLYYARARVATFTSMSTQPKATKLTVGQDYGVTLEVTGEGDDHKPQYTADYGQSPATIVRDILNSTTLGVRAEKDGFHIVLADNSTTPIAYTYVDGTHDFFADVFRQAVIIPNKITYTNLAPNEVGTQIVGSNRDVTSEDEIGSIELIIVDDAVTSPAIATNLAIRAIKRLKRDAAQGSLIAPVNVGQEIWDVVRVDDSARSGKDFTGRATSILRAYVPGEYTIQIAMGATPLGRLNTGRETPFVTPTPGVPAGMPSVGAPPIGGVGVPPIGPIPELPWRVDLWHNTALPRRELGPSLGTGSGRTNTRLSPSGEVVAESHIRLDASQELRLRELAANGTAYVGFVAPDSVPSSQIWKLPGSDGVDGQALITDGLGNLGWQTISAGDPSTVVADFNPDPPSVRASDASHTLTDSNPTVATSVA